MTDDHLRSCTMLSHTHTQSDGVAQRIDRMASMDHASRQRGGVAPYAYRGQWNACVCMVMCVCVLGAGKMGGFKLWIL
jgi:hypothetical protein